ncbi:MAG TPA: hypothetical protein VGC55_00010 [Dokdonella sp.]
MKCFVFFVVALWAADGWARTSSESFERVFPQEYTQMLRNAKIAYEHERYDEAFRLFQRTACAGDKESQSALGRMYLLGQGVTRDDLVGYAWLKVAAEILFPGYQKIVHQLEDAMTPQQRSIADVEANQRIALYGIAATNMSCGKTASRRGHIVDQIECTPERDGARFLLRRCADAPAP